MSSDQPKTELAMMKRDTVDQVTEKVNALQTDGQIKFPPSYSPENALHSAWLTLQETKTGKNSGYKPVLEYCTKNSIANSLLDMVVQGLNPNKKQGYFIAYGQTLVFQRSYFGTQAVTKRVTGAKDIDAQPIYEGDQVNYEITKGRITDLSHKQSFDNINKDAILGAYCVIDLGDGKDPYIELMTIDELQKAWDKNLAKESADSTHKKYTQEMAKKTVINRACKKYLNTSDDSSVLMETIHENDQRIENVSDDARQEINDNANTEVLDVDPEVIDADEAEKRRKAKEDQEKQDKQDKQPAGDGVPF